MTEEEKFRFDLTGFLVRPAIISPDEVAAIVDQIDRIKNDPESLPAAHRGVPGIVRGQGSYARAQCIRTRRRD